MKVLNAEGLHYKNLNELIFEAINSGEDHIKVENVMGHRYIGDGLKADESVRIDVYGTAGNDLGAFMNGLSIRIYGNAQDGIGNTMNAGKIFVHGDAGDVLCYGMRGGEVYIKGDVGYRVGIHMKEYMNFIPKVVIGGCAGDFFGEYMAGGYLILLGLDKSDQKPVIGDYIATGMHGGRIYIRGNVDSDKLSKEAKVFDLDQDDFNIIQTLIVNFCKEFDLDIKNIMNEKFVKLIPVSKRPYGRLYVPSWHTITNRKEVVPGSFETNGYPKIRNIRER